MTDDRPRPQYGEYATPEQVAAAMGHRYVPPVEVSPPPPALTETDEPESLRLPGNAVDRFATIFQLGIGLVFLINSDFFHIGEDTNIVANQLGIGPTVSSSIDRFGWLLLSVNVLLYLATIVFAYARLRRAKLAFWVPVLGFLAFGVFLTIFGAVADRA